MPKSVASREAENPSAKQVAFHMQYTSSPHHPSMAAWGKKMKSMIREVKGAGISFCILPAAVAALRPHFFSVHATQVDAGPTELHLRHPRVKPEGEEGMGSLLRQHKPVFVLLLRHHAAL